MVAALAKVETGIERADDPILHDEKLWQVVSSGDLGGLTPRQKSDYYLYRCRQEGLNPASQPFTYVKFQGKETLYAGKVAADQLRKIHGVSITSVQCKDDGEIIECEVRVRDREGREDVEFGTVFVGTSRGQDRANAKLKCLTKAKRRATFSICGTGALDETEVETIPGARIAPVETIPERQVEHSEPVAAKLVISEDYQDAHVEDEDGHIIDAETGEIVQERTLIEALADSEGWVSPEEAQAEHVQARQRDLWASAQEMGYDWAHFNKVRRESKLPELDKMNTTQVKDMFEVLQMHSTRPQGQPGNDGHTR